MNALAQSVLLVVTAPSVWEFTARLARSAFNARQFRIDSLVFVILVCLPALAGFLLYRLRVKATTRKLEDESVLSELAMLRTVVANLPDPIYMKDAESRFLMANEATAKNLGAASVADIVGKTDFDFYPEELARSFFEDERKVLLSGKPQVSKEERIKDANGGVRYLLSTKVPLFDGAGRAVGIVGVGRNITALKGVEAELRRVQEELKFKAAHDSLTSLLNRGAILEMLERELSRGQRENSSTAIFLGDLDHFKVANDTLGHPIGDEILCEVASRLLCAVRAYDLVGRYGGEEFLVVLPGCAGADALSRANHLRKAIDALPIHTSRGPVSLTISIGVIIARDWGNPTSTDILREVDKALYAAKDAGRNQCWLAEPALH